MLERMIRVRRKELFFAMIIVAGAYFLGFVVDIATLFDQGNLLNEELGGAGLIMAISGMGIALMVGFTYFSTRFCMVVSFGQTRRKFLMEEILFTVFEVLFGAVALLVFYGIGYLMYVVIFKVPYLSVSDFFFLDLAVLAFGIILGIWIRVLFGAVILKFRGYVQYLFALLICAEFTIFRLSEYVQPGLWLVPVAAGVWLFGMVLGIRSLMRQSV